MKPISTGWQRLPLGARMFFLVVNPERKQFVAKYLFDKDILGRDHAELAQLLKKRQAQAIRDLADLSLRSTFHG